MITEHPTASPDAPGAAEADTAPDRSPERIRLTAPDVLKGGAVLGLVVLEAFRAVSGGSLLAGEVLVVLSGFLCTRAIARVDEHGGAAQLLGRHAVRLAVPWIPVLALLGYWGQFASGPIDALRTPANATASMFLVSNWWYITSGQSWFSRVDASPLLATWGISMLVQCQAILLVVWFAFVRRRQQRARIADSGSGRSRTALYVTGGFALASAAWMAFLSRLHALVQNGMLPLGIDPFASEPWLRTFLNIDPFADDTRLAISTDTRLQGFLVGVLAAQLVARGVSAGWSPRLRSLLRAGATIALAALVMGTGRETSWIYLGGFLLVGALVTVILLVSLVAPATTPGAGADLPAGAQPAAPERGTAVRLATLASRPLALLGRASYCVYAWYFPIYVYVSVPSTRWPPVQVSAVRLVAPLVLGTLTHAALHSRPVVSHRMRAQGDARLRWGAVLLTVMMVVASSRVIEAQRPDFLRVESDGRLPVLFAGDSMAYILGYETTSYSTDAKFGVLSRLSAFPGCGLTNGVLLNRGSAATAAEGCTHWRTNWAREVDVWDPAATLVLAWAWELYDHELQEDGKTVRYDVGTPAWARHEAGILEDVIAALTRRNGRVVFLTMPCVDPDADMPQHPTTEATELFRVKAMNDELRAAAARHPDQVTVVDLYSFLCPDGNYRARIDGVLVSDDGVHFTHEGAQLLWDQFIGPRLTDILETDRRVASSQG